MSKLRGEERLREAGGRWIIIRPSLMYGVGSHRSGGFNGFMEEKWSRGEAAPLFTDQYRSFLYVDDLSRAVEQVAVIRPAWNELYVCGGAERMSRAEFGLRYADARGVDRGMCRPMKAHELSGYVGGPSNIILDTAKLFATGWKPTATETALRQIVQHLVPAQ
jgi:dTDP-4-dehydrorhamnose reductase